MARPATLLLLTVVTLTLGSFPATQALKLQQLTLLVATVISAAMALLVSGHLFFGWSTVAHCLHQAATGRSYYQLSYCCGR